MSHPGKFVSVNLNRSYGQPAPSHHGGGRPSRPPGSSSGGGGGMVVLSRARGSSVAKPQPPKLSVPPPLNLPSLRKEHERFDGAAMAAGGGAASAPVRSGAPTAGWTKPAPAAAEKPPASVALPGSGPRPPSYGFPEKAVVLRGEDFPSLKAAVAPPPPPPAQRQKDADGARVATPETRPMPLGMRPQVTPSRAAESLASTGGTGAGAHASAEKAQRNDLGPLPLVRLRYDSDWADDERDTGLTLPERDSRERGFASTLDAANTSRINTSSTVSHLEDDEWPSENNEDRQKQDEYDEESNSYQEDEINEGDDENLDLDDEFAEGHGSHVEIEPVILGFDEGVQVEIPPNPELELISMKNTHSGVMEQQVGSGSVCPSDFVTEAEKALQNLALDQINALTDETKGEPSNSLVTSVPGSKLPPASSTDPIMPPASAHSDSQKLSAPAINQMVDAEGFHNLLDRSSVGENTCRVSKPESHRNHDISLKRNYKPTSDNREYSQVNSDAKVVSGPKAPGAVPAGRGRKYGYAVKEPNIRSKRQIMSVRRELREKENRSKMRIAKAPRKQHQVSLHSSSSPNLNKGTVSLAEPSKKALDSVMAVEGRVIDPAESSVTLKGDKASMTPIGPPLVNTESHSNYYAKKPIQSQPSSDMVNSSSAVKLVAGLSEDNNKAMPISTPFNMGTWDNSQLNQQVMPLTQTQLDEAMKPGKFEQADSGFSLEPNNALSPTIASEKAFPSSASPINSLLAGEKIQFGAVTSPTVLPPVSRTITSGLGPPGSSRPDMKIDRNLPGDSNSTAILFDKEMAIAKEPSPNSDDVEAEAEAEAAASAVAVAAISTDEIVGSGADATTASASDNKSFGNKDLAGLTSGGACQAGQSSTDEPLSVALPADLVSSLKEAMLYLQHHWELGHNATLGLSHFIVLQLGLLVLSLALEGYQAYKPDWKQNQGPSVVGVSQSDPSNQNIVPGQV
ncbi:hypothetical protein E2562_006984 [Oryza meyeriana var. granulata]|uniref:Uncharacterized protein n=1 Tax=Oryza meyeriana var. granulata TaxID=110450 RepID=A0A6G1E9F5_9ORYZ|nr:hypothetical protein E2562_006984 [Oryza meyeriana var. granulata]